MSGRLKEVIIVNGNNHFPVDIERTVEKCHEAIRSNCVAAVSVDDDGDERIVIIVEVDRKNLAACGSERRAPSEATEALKNEVAGAIREAVVTGHDLSVQAVCLIRHSTIPKTTSGKIQRHLCRERYLRGELALV